LRVAGIVALDGQYADARVSVVFQFPSFVK
jgi:hypothetical protein